MAIYFVHAKDIHTISYKIRDIEVYPLKYRGVLFPEQLELSRVYRKVSFLIKNTVKLKRK